MAIFLRISPSRPAWFTVLPLRFYHAYVLGLRGGRRPAKPGSGILGSSSTRPWKNIWPPPAGLHAADLRKRTSGLERRFEKAFGRGAGGPAFLTKLQTVRHLEEFLAGYQRPLVAGLEAEGRPLVIDGLERKITVVREVVRPGGSSARPEAFRLTAKIDRIERRGSDLYVLDYKTSHDDRPLRIDFRGLAARIAGIEGLPPDPDFSIGTGVCQALRESAGACDRSTRSPNRRPRPGARAIHGRFFLARAAASVPGSDLAFRAPRTASGRARGIPDEAAGRLINRLLLEISIGRASPPPEPAWRRLCPFPAFCGRL
jgi:hypothetical protein